MPEFLRRYKIEFNEKKDKWELFSGDKVIASGDDKEKLEYVFKTILFFPFK
jgi:hypothetical protein